MNTLEYFRGSGGSLGAAARAARGGRWWRRPWLRVFVSHRARLQLARSASVGQGFVLLALISVLSGVLSASPTRLHAVLARVVESKLEAGWSLLPPARELLDGGLSAGKTTLIFTALYFGVLCAVLTIGASAWTRFARSRTWSRCFAAMSVAASPVLWFFVLLQLESLAPLVPGAVTGTAWWNPMTNYVHFGVLILAVPLLGVWAADVNRIWLGLDLGEGGGMRAEG